jgi:hypothetical protein
MVINRRGVGDCEEVQEAKRGQLRQSLVENLIEIALIFAVVDRRSPTAAGMPFRTGGRVLLPINTKLTHIDAAIGVGLPFHIWTPGSNHFNAVLVLAGNQDRCGDISRVEQVLAWGECRFLKISVDRFRHHLIGDRSRGRRDMGDEMGTILITGFGQMDFVPSPPRLALFAVAGFLIVGRIDEESRRSNIVIASPTDVTILPIVILDPDAAQNLDSWDLTQQGRSVWREDLGQQGRAISPDDFCQRLAVRLTLWETTLLNPMPIAMNPLFLTVLKEPVTGNNGKTVERKAHGFTNAHKSIDGSHSSEHMGRVAALLLALFEPSMFFEDGEHRV